MQKQKKHEHPEVNLGNPIQFMCGCGCQILANGRTLDRPQITVQHTLQWWRNALLLQPTFTPTVSARMAKPRSTRIRSILSADKNQQLALSLWWWNRH